MADPAVPGTTGAVYRRIVGSRIRSQLSYRASFALDVVAQTIGQSIELVAVLVVFTQVEQLGGFARHEVLVMYGIAATAFGLADLAVGQVEELANHIRTGELDVLLLRPLGALAQIISADVALKRLGRVGAGLAVLAHALATAGIEWTPVRVLLAATAPLVGAVIFGAVWVAANTVSFWVVDGREFSNSVTYGSNFSTSYPATVYGPWVRRVLCFAVPSAFVAYFPALALLGRTDPLGLPAALPYCAPPVAALTVVAAALVWRAGVRRYQGTGS
ncbi:ABC transporter permease [Pseudonocardia broussonetiae]|uniref:ABC transporter permease n=1 Tax=Pseudonocardia broussonetiae TaxID=2736640 RepID=UPI001F0452E6|nr:ABC-2 family transporter protein [Pseudonocardia broussonetiae]